MPEYLTAFIGVVLGFGASYLLERTKRNERRRELLRQELLLLCSEFLRDIQVIWQAQQQLADAIDDFQTGREIKDRELRDIGWKKRSEAFALQKEPRDRVTLTLSKLRILAPTLEPSATALFGAARAYKLEEHDTFTARHARALEEFESQARAMLL